MDQHVFPELKCQNKPSGGDYNFAPLLPPSLVVEDGINELGELVSSGRYFDGSPLSISYVGEDSEEGEGMICLWGSF